MIYLQLIRIEDQATVWNYSTLVDLDYEAEIACTVDENGTDLIVVVSGHVSHAGDAANAAKRYAPLTWP